MPRDSVGAREIKSGAVRSSEVRNGSLTATDFQPGTLGRGPAGASGAAGDSGPTGARGATGPAGPSGTTIRATITGSTPTTAPLTPAFAEVPLDNATWTQRAGELNLVFGEFDLRLPASTSQCSADPANRYLYYQLNRGGKAITQAIIYLYTATGDIKLRVPGYRQSPTPGVIPSDGLPFVLPPATDTTEALSLVIRDFCDAGAHYEVRAVRLYVVALG